MTEVITRDDIATRPGGGVSKHLLAPYHHAALEPHIDVRTMMLHHGKQHASYVEKLNTALEAFPDLQRETALWLLLNDAWENAYNLKHENRRADHLNGWWPVVNWQEAGRRYDRCDYSAEQRREDDGCTPAPGAINPQLS